MRAYAKELLRTLTGSLSRFISIVAIVALGVFFFVGIRATSPDMKETTGQYIVDLNMFDVHVYAPYGFTDEDVAAIQSVEGVDEVDSAYSIDMVCQGAEENLIFTMEQLPKESELNQVELIEGRMPQADDECVVDTLILKNSDYKIGDTITVSPGEDQKEDPLKITTFKIVGSVKSPLYLSLLDRGVSTLGSGKVVGFVLINKDVFNLDAYTDIYISAKYTLGNSPLYDEYLNSLDPLVATLKSLGEQRAHIRGDEVKNEAQQKIDDAKKEVADAEKELADAKKKLDDAKIEIADGEKEIKSATATFNSEIASAQKKIDDGKAELASAKTQIDENEKTLIASQASLDEGQAQITAGLLEVANNKLTLEAQKPYMTAEQYDTALAALNAAESELNAQQIALTENQNTVTAGFTELEKAKSDYSAGVAELAASEKTFLSEKATGQKKLNDAKATLAKAKTDLAKGQSEYDDKSVTAYSDIAEAKVDIADGQKKIDELIEAKWYVLDVGDNAGVYGYKQDAERLASIGDVFPILFFLVAALVCLTAMTRMVEEDRTKIGTLKALGYTKKAIAFKYLIYALLASVIGSLIGAMVGFKFLPVVIATAYSSLYQVPSTITPIRADLQAQATAFSVIATTIPALIVCFKELVNMPAVLMRPKTPKAGKRILLEYVPFIWKKLSFTKKVTLRNLFRYKARFIMTLLGIAGCTMLVLTGFGLNDSISGIVDKTFNEIATYDGVVALSSTDDLSNVLSTDTRINSYLYASRESVKVKRDQTVESGVQIIVPKQDIKPFINIHTVTGNQPLSITDDGVIITQKLSEILKVKVGDTISLINEEDDKNATVTVTGICEFYLGHYIYMSEKGYENAFGTVAKTNAAIIKINDLPANEEGLSTTLLSEGALNVSLNSTQKASFDDSISNVIYVVFVLIASAAALAFVVLFSLTSINIEERIRELATIKVLGFYDREVAAYVYRENMLLTVLGALLGLVFGYFMHGYILTTMEKDVLKFTRYISPQSYLFAFLLTLVFAIIVNVIMNSRLKRINMVESLKSSE